MNLESKIEAVLFFKADPMSVADLARIFSVSDEEMQNKVESLAKSLMERGLTLIQNGGTVTLVTDARVSDVIERITQEEISGELSRAAKETLAVITYKNPISKREIDYIRGVNSATILKSLSLRGLIERESCLAGDNAVLYKPSADFLAYLGISKVDELPEHDKIQEKIKSLFLLDEKEEKDTENE